MEKSIIRRNTIILLLMLSIALFFMIRIWPLCDVVKHIESNQQAVSEVKLVEEDGFTSKDKKLQTVYFQYDHIKKVKIYMACKFGSYRDVVLFRLYDDSFTAIYSEEYGCRRIENEGYLVATPDIDVVVGQPYYYEIIVPEDSKSFIGLPISNNSNLLQNENGILYIDGIIDTEKSLIADFEYTKPLSLVRILGYDAIIWALFILVYFITRLVLNRYDKSSSKYAINRMIKAIATVLVVIAAIVSFIFATVMNVFGGEYADRVVYTLGIVGVLGWSLYGIWTSRINKVSKLLDENDVEKYRSIVIREYIQVWSFGLAIYSLCNYVNADRGYLQATNTRWMLIFFGIALLMAQTERQFLNLFSYIWIAVSIIGSVIYCYGIQDNEKATLAKLSATVVAVWGVTVINALLQIRLENIKKLRTPYTLLWIIFAIMMYIYRYEKMWPFVATLPFVVVVLYDLKVLSKARLLNNFARGVLLSFAIVVLFSFLHRPYHFWIHYRYPMMFHTVACTGMYLALVFAVALGKLYSKWNNNNELMEKGKEELFILSIVVGFVLLCMARTALLAVVVCTLVVSVIHKVYYNKSFIRFIKEWMIMGGSILVGFFIVFTSARVFPSLSKSPVYYSVEQQASYFSIEKYDYIDSTKYMTVDRYFRLFFGRFMNVYYDSEASKEARNEELSSGLIVSNTDSAVVGTIDIEPETDRRNYVIVQENDKTNGRLDIFKAYISNLTIKGHPEMEADGTVYVHAHNAYLQVAHDFGIIAGVLFIVICGYTFVLCIIKYIKYGKKYGLFLVPLSVVTSFGVVSLTEWTYHPCIPIGFSFMFISALLLQKEEKGQ